MDIVFQYYNEIVLAFGDYEVDYNNGIIIIAVPESTKSFEVLCSKIKEHLDRVAETLEPREKDIQIKVLRGQEELEITLSKEEV